MNEFLSLLIGAIVTWFGIWVTNNKTLREGLSKLLLKKLNRESINKIPLKEHKIFMQLKSHKNTFSNIYLFNNESKILFFQTYMDLLFKNIEVMLINIIENKENKNNIESLVSEELNRLLEVFNNEINSTLQCPEKVEKQFTIWKTMINSELKKSVELILNDNLIESPYITVYRLCDQLVTMTNITLTTGSLTFSQMNGAFDNVKIEDVVKI